MNFIKNQESLLELGLLLKNSEYQYFAPIPLSHSRVMKRPRDPKPSLRDLFGWSREFQESEIDPTLFKMMKQAEILNEVREGWFKSEVRFSRYGSSLFMHSAYPTLADASVFFGPDTHRFMRFVDQELRKEGRLFERGLDLGCGSGAAGIRFASWCTGELILSDINEKALEYSAMNLRLNSPTTKAVFRTQKSDLFSHLEGSFDWIIANPPFLIDQEKRAYRNGGGRFGAGLSERILLDSLERLNPKGRLFLYTASAIHQGQDLFLEFVKKTMDGRSECYSYSEIDADIFGEELEEDSYLEVDRIAAVGLSVTKI